MNAGFNHMHIAYVIPAHVQSKLGRTAFNRPRREYELFLQDKRAVLLDNDLLAPPPSGKKPVFARYFKSMELPSAVLEAHARTPFDAIVTSGEDVGLRLALLMLRKGVKTKLFIITHGSFFASRKFAVLMQALRSQRYVHFLCLSESLRTRLIRDFGVAEAQAHNTGYGADLAFFAPEACEKETPADASARPIIASAGMANRDYKTLVEAVRRLPADVRIAADSAWYPTSVDVAGTELPPNVDVRSYGDYVGLRGLYARAAFVVVPLYPALHACGYAVIAEAMAMGKAVIVTHTDSPSDFIVEGQTGYYVPVGDAPALRARIQHLLERPDLAREMGKRARSRMEAHFSLEGYRDALADAIQRAVTANKSSAR